MSVAASGVNDSRQCPYRLHADIVGSCFQDAEEPSYCEYHVYDSSILQVFYTYFDGEVFAKKELTPGVNAYTPQLIQDDFRFTEQRRVTFDPSQENPWQVNYSLPDKADSVSKRLTLDAFEVNDAGFDTFVRDNWRDITEGDGKVFRFLSIVHGRAVTMSVSARDLQSCDLAKSHQAEWLADVANPVCLRVGVENIFLRLLAPHLALLYDADSRRLLAFDGVVNLLNSEQKRQSCLLTYQYQRL